LATASRRPQRGGQTVIGVGLGLFDEASSPPRSAALAIVGVTLLAREHIRPQWSHL
jgi:hypothetical protein